VKIDASTLTSHATSILTAAGADEVEAESVSEALVWCDRVGRANQGVWRLPILADRLSRGLYHSPCRLDLTQTAPSVALLDADNGLGHWVATRGMDAAIELARKSGVGVVGVRKGNFFGAGS